MSGAISFFSGAFNSFFDLLFDQMGKGIWIWLVALGVVAALFLATVVRRLF